MSILKIVLLIIVLIIVGGIVWISFKSKEKDLSREIYLDKIGKVQRQLLGNFSVVKQKVFTEYLTSILPDNDRIIASSYNKGVFRFIDDNASFEKLVNVGDDPFSVAEVSHIFMNEEKQLLVYDNNNQKVKFYDVAGDPQHNKTITLNDISGIEGLYIGNGRFASLNKEENDFGLSIYSFDQEKLIGHSEIANLYGLDKKFHRCAPYLLGGDLAYDDGRIFHLVTHGGLVGVFTETGEFLYTFQTIDKAPLQTGKFVDKVGLSYCDINPGFPTNFSIAVKNDKIYILSNIVYSNENHQRSLDVYTTEGRYTGSYLLPDLAKGEQPRSVTLSATDDYFYVKYDEGNIVVYNVENQLQ